MLCLAMTAVLSAANHGGFYTNLTPSQLRKGAAFNEPLHNKAYGNAQAYTFDAQEYLIRNPNSSVPPGVHPLWDLSYDIEKIDLQEWLWANIHASQKGRVRRG